MNTKKLLEQLLKSGQSMLQEQSGRSGKRPSSGTGFGSSGLGGSLGQSLGKGALASSAFSLLMGSKRGRKMGMKGLKYGGLAALGVLAYRAYSDWQQQNAATAPAEPPRTIDRLSGSEAEAHSHAILKALVAAAKADGHIDDRERQLIEEELGKLADDGETRAWLETELNKPLDPKEVASASTSLEMASEMYLVSLMMVDDKNYMERAYLDELARNLKLDASLKASLESQAEQA
ncbi:MAG: tellurite resistance TerB family protein [Candidatus Binatia bacterium]